jgi:hypothetical protein
MPDEKGLRPDDLFRILIDLINDTNNLPRVIQVVFKEFNDAAVG